MAGKLEGLEAGKLRRWEDFEFGSWNAEVGKERRWEGEKMGR